MEEYHLSCGAMLAPADTLRVLRVRWLSATGKKTLDGRRSSRGIYAVAVDEAVVGAATARWMTGRLNRRDGEMDDGSSSGEVDEGRRTVVVDGVVGEEAPAGQR